MGWAWHATILFSQVMFDSIKVCVIPNKGFARQRCKTWFSMAELSPCLKLYRTGLAESWTLHYQSNCIKWLWSDQMENLIQFGRPRSPAFPAVILHFLCVERGYFCCLLVMLSCARVILEFQIHQKLTRSLHPGRHYQSMTWSNNKIWKSALNLN